VKTLFWYFIAGFCATGFGRLHLGQQREIISLQLDAAKLRQEIRDTTATPYWMAECERRLGDLERNAGVCQ
jgi:hypothetical protein